MEDIGKIILLLLLFGLPSIIGMIKSASKKEAPRTYSAANSTKPAPAPVKEETAMPVHHPKPVQPVATASADFDIRNGTLWQYRGHEAHVRVPDGVVRIAEHAFTRTETHTRPVQGLPPVRPEWAGPDWEPPLEEYVEAKGLDFLREVDLPESVEEIHKQAFYECANLERVHLPGKLRAIGSQAFMMCTKLSIIELPESLCEIGAQAFAFCEQLQQIRLPGSFVQFGSGAFQSCTGLRSVAVCKGIERIGSHAFANCGNLTEMLLPESVQEIGTGAFAHCVRLEQVCLPKGLQAIGREAFRRCLSLQRIEVPTDTVIKDRAFVDAPTEVIRKKAKPGKTTDDAAFKAINSGEKIAVSTNEKNTMPVKKTEPVKPAATASADFDIQNGVLLKYRGREAHVRVPDGVVRIAKHAFTRTVTRTRVVQGLPPMLAEWAGEEWVTPHDEEYEETEGLDFLREVYLPESVERIDSQAFFGCTSLKRIEAPEKTIIEDGAFGSTRTEIVRREAGKPRNIKANYAEFMAMSDAEKAAVTVLDLSSCDFRTMNFLNLCQGAENLRWVMLSDTILDPRCEVYALDGCGHYRHPETFVDDYGVICWYGKGNTPSQAYESRRPHMTPFVNATDRERCYALGLKEDVRLEMICSPSPARETTSVAYDRPESPSPSRGGSVKPSMLWTLEDEYRTGGWMDDES